MDREFAPGVVDNSPESSIMQFKKANDHQTNEPTLINREFAVVLYRALRMICSWLEQTYSLGGNK